MNDNWFRPALIAVACLAGAAQAQVTPPPLPPGSHMVRPEPGMNEEERKRYVRAHHHKMHHHKDYTRDDSIHGPEPERVMHGQGHRHGGAAGMGAGGIGAGGTRGGAAAGGAGTGPAREKTDKGASGYFYGTEKK